MTKHWWARIGDGYGRWVPTGQTDKTLAEDYIAAYTYRRVIEWLLL